MAIGIRQGRALVRVWRLEVRGGRVHLPETVIGAPDGANASRRLVRFRLAADAAGRDCLVLQVYDLRRRAPGGRGRGPGGRWRIEPSRGC